MDATMMRDPPCLNSGKRHELRGEKFESRNLVPFRSDLIPLIWTSHALFCSRRHFAKGTLAILKPEATVPHTTQSEPIPLSQYESQFEENQYQLRREKLAQIAEIGQRAGLSAAEAAFPNGFAFTHTIPELRLIGEPLSTEHLAETKHEAAIAGRIMALRVQGKAGFAQLQQGGQRLQIYVRRDDVGEDMFALYKLLDLGDHIGLRGYLMRTRTGELTLHAAPLGDAPAISFLAKSMLALPDKYHGLEDVELRYRQRYVDLIVNSGTLTKSEVATTPEVLSSVVEGGESAGPGTAQSIPGTSAVTDAAADNAQHEDAPVNVREVFVKRAAVLRAIRAFFDSRGYLEVETPMLHTIAGGAAARPFTTHHNALDIPLSLRIAPELYLKRLVVGGMDRVYEINRNFRNEGVSTRHNPEFTMLEFYQAYANYEDLMQLTPELIAFVAEQVNGGTTTHFNSNLIDLAPHAWTKLSMREAIIKFWPADAEGAPTHESFASSDALTHWLFKFTDPDPDPSAFAAILRGADYMGMMLKYRELFGQLAMRHTRIVKGGEHYGKIIAEIFELLAEEHLIQPTIIYDFPLAVSPLSKVKPDEPDWVERFEFYIGGFEVGNAFSELNDPDDQRLRFEAQVADRDPESMAAIDEDYVRALGYGLPPTAGEGIGIDRLTMLLTGSRSIRDVILFPLMRPYTKPPITDEPYGESAE